MFCRRNGEADQHKDDNLPKPAKAHAHTISVQHRVLLTDIGITPANQYLIRPAGKNTL